MITLNNGLWGALLAAFTIDSRGGIRIHSRAMAVQKPRFERQVEEVLQTFDFERVHRVMESLSWTWANLDRVPTRAELIAEARRLLAELDAKPGVLGSGGLRASYKEDGTLSLKFILCESWSDLNEDSPAH